jgi:hypothetical protein
MHPRRVVRNVFVRADFRVLYRGAEQLTDTR